jgi:hypothetical protein
MTWDALLCCEETGRLLKLRRDYCAYVSAKTGSVTGESRLNHSCSGEPGNNNVSKHHTSRNMLLVLDSNDAAQ